MIESIPWEKVGAFFTAASIAVGGAYAAWLKHRKNVAETRAVVAEDSARSAVADAQKTVYETLVNRVAMLETDVTKLRDDLQAERKLSRSLQVHVMRLEDMMRKAGMEPPPFTGVG